MILPCVYALIDLEPHREAAAAQPVLVLQFVPDAVVSGPISLNSQSVYHTSMRHHQFFEEPTMKEIENRQILNKRKK